MMRSMSKHRSIYPVILLSFLAAACGYRFAGQGTLPKGIERIYIQVFDNRTNQTGIERIVTNQVVFEFTRQRDTILTNSPQEAQAVLKGVVKSIRTATISRVNTEIASERELIMTLNVKLVKQGGEVVWAANGLSERATYDVSPGADMLATNLNKNRAIARVARRLSERIFSQLTDDF